MLYPASAFKLFYRSMSLSQSFSIQIHFYTLMDLSISVYEYNIHQCFKRNR